MRLACVESNDRHSGRQEVGRQRLQPRMDWWRDSRADDVEPFPCEVSTLIFLVRRLSCRADLCYPTKQAVVSATTSILAQLANANPAARRSQPGPELLLPVVAAALGEQLEAQRMRLQLDRGGAVFAVARREELLRSADVEGSDFDEMHALERQARRDEEDEQLQRLSELHEDHAALQRAGRHEESDAALQHMERLGQRWGVRVPPIVVAQGARLRVLAIDPENWCSVTPDDDASAEEGGGGERGCVPAAALQALPPGTVSQAEELKRQREAEEERVRKEAEDAAKEAEAKRLKEEVQRHLAEKKRLKQEEEAAAAAAAAEAERVAKEAEEAEVAKKEAAAEAARVEAKREEAAAARRQQQQEQEKKERSPAKRASSSTSRDDDDDPVPEREVPPSSSSSDSSSSSEEESDDDDLRALGITVSRGRGSGSTKKKQSQQKKKKQAQKKKKQAQYTLTQWTKRIAMPPWLRSTTQRTRPP